MRIKKGRGKGLIILNKLTVLEVNLWQEKILEEKSNRFLDIQEIGYGVFQ